MKFYSARLVWVFALNTLIACASKQVKREYVETETDNLTEAVMDQNLDKARAALAKGGDPNYLFRGTTPLFFRALRHGLPWAEAFADAGVDVNLHDWKKNTALIAMVDQRNHEAMRWLIRRDADLNHRSFHGHTALLLAYIHDDATSIAMLKKAGAKEDIFTHSVSGNAEGLQERVRAGESVNEYNSYGTPALVYAAGFGRTECVRMLLSLSASVSVSDRENGITSVMAVVMSDIPNKTEILQLLAKGVPNLNITTADGERPIVVAARRQENEVVRLLAELGADVNARDEKGATALSYVTDAETEKFLLARRAKCGDPKRFTCVRGGKRTEKSKVIASDGLYLRDAPSIEATKLTLMKAGATVMILSRAPGKDHEYHDGRSGVWCRVKFQGREGFAFSGFLD